MCMRGWRERFALCLSYGTDDFKHILSTLAGNTANTTANTNVTHFLKLLKILLISAWSVHCEQL